MGSAIFGSPGFGAAYIIPTDMPFTASPLQVTVLLPCTLPWVNLGTFKPNALSISAGVKSLQGSTCAVAGNMKASRTNANTAIRRFMYFSYSPFCKVGPSGWPLTRGACDGNVGASNVQAVKPFINWQ